MESSCRGARGRVVRWCAQLKALRPHPIAVTLVVGTLVARTVWFMVIPFLALYLTRVKELDPLTIGTIIGVSPLVGMVGGFVGGSLSDRIGRLPVMLGAVFMWTLVFVGFAFADAPAVFFLLNALNGLCRAIFEPTGQALLADVTPPDKRLWAFNARYAAINVGAALGPLLGAQMGAAQSTALFFVPAAFYGVYGAVLYGMMRRYRQTLPYAKDGRGARLRQAVQVIGTDRAFGWFLLGSLLVNAAYAQMSSTLPQYLDRAPDIADASSFYAVLVSTNAVSVLALQLPLSLLARRAHPLTAIQVGCFCYAVGLLGFGCFVSLPGLMAAMVVFTAGEVLSVLMSALFVDRVAPPAMRGAYFGALGLASLGSSVGPLIGGVLLRAFGDASGLAVFGGLALLALLALPAFHLGRRRERKAMAQGFGAFLSK